MKVYESKVFDVVKLDNGYEIVDHPGAVVVLPILAIRHDSIDILILKHERPAIGCEIYELPAGTMDVQNEIPEQCAARELHEETGYLANLIVHLGDIYPSPGYTNEKIQMFVARGLSKTADPSGDDSKYIKVETLTINWREEWTKQFVDAKTIAALAHYQGLNITKLSTEE